ncbi:hypothetical protein [Myxococcus eversor]|uniref:hypothetical protein n=1 Tax=Myxococcus eversor TaxID=2709661 RepID=UPI0013CF595C|nr:hypothetical protein [Myxococcus eversor]
MKTRFKNAWLLSLAATLLLACGGSANEPLDGDSPAPTAIPEEYIGQDETVFNEDIPVGEFKACCYAICATDTVWRGPFPNVAAGNCTNYGKYYCKQRRLAFVGAKWDNC